MITQSRKPQQNRVLQFHFWRAAARLMAVALLCCVIAPLQPGAQAAQVVELPPAQPDINGTQYLSIPAAAFHPEAYYYYYYTNYGSELIFQGVDYGSTPSFYAPLELPDLSTITKVTFWYSKASSSGNHILRLYRTLLSEGSIPTINVLAELHSGAGSGYDFASTSAGFSALVDNDTYGYFLKYSPDLIDDVFYRVLVEYTLPGGTPDPETLNIPPAAFVNYLDSSTLENIGNLVRNLNFISSFQIQSPVLLPQGANVEDTKFYYYDNDATVEIEAHLHRTNLAGSWDPALGMADLYSSGTPGWSAESEPVARYETIDNSRYAYWVYYTLPPKTSPGITIQARDFRIDYERGPAYPIQSISIPAAAFTPMEEGQSYENHGRFLKSFGDSKTFVAPLYLPHGKYIRSVRFYYENHNSPAAETRAYLRGLDAPLGFYYPNVYLESGGSGWTFTDSGLLEGLQVNNQTTRYWLEWQVLYGYTPGSYLLPSGMVVEVSDFNTLLFLPVVKK